MTTGRSAKVLKLVFGLIINSTKLKMMAAFLSSMFSINVILKSLCNTVILLSSVSSLKSQKNISFTATFT